MGFDSTARRAGRLARCNELAILAGNDDALTMHRTIRNSYIRHKSESRIMPENFAIRHIRGGMPAGPAGRCLGDPTSARMPDGRRATTGGRVAACAADGASAARRAGTVRRRPAGASGQRCPAGIGPRAPGTFFAQGNIRHARPDARRRSVVFPKKIRGGVSTRPSPPALLQMTHLAGRWLTH